MDFLNLTGPCYAIQVADSVQKFTSYVYVVKVKFVPLLSGPTYNEHAAEGADFFVSKSFGFFGDSKSAISSRC